jgi:hypothetical protein
MAQIIGGNLDDYRTRFLRHMQTQTHLRPVGEDAKKHGMLMNLSASLPPEVAADFLRRLEELVKEFDDFPRDPDGVRFEGLVSWFTPAWPTDEDDRPGPAS